MSKTFDEFKNNMKSTMLELKEENLKYIWDTIDESYYTMEELKCEEIYDENDFYFIVDVDLHSLLVYLEDLKPEDIMQRVGNMYGDIVEFLYLKEDNMYVMALGTR